jgi:hypothetical protein
MSNYQPGLRPSTQKFLGTWNVESITADERHDLLSSIKRKDDARNAIPDTDSKDFESLKQVYADECDRVTSLRRKFNDRYGVTKQRRASKSEQSKKVLTIDRPHRKKLIV